MFYQSLSDAYELEMYIKNVEGFEGEGDFLSKFNVEIRDEITFTISKKRFTEELIAKWISYYTRRWPVNQQDH